MLSFNAARMCAVLLTLAMIPARLLAAPRPTGTMVLVADSRGLPAWQAWWANLYSESHFYFALFTVAVVASLGLLIGKITDLLLARLGINLKSRVLAEH